MSTDTPSRAPAPSRPNAPPKVFFPCLDGLRAIAALIVVVFHTSNNVAYFAEPITRAANDTRGVWAAAGILARLGNWGVAIFFVLSGFLLYRPFVAAWLQGRSVGSLQSYLARRLVRIVPAYWIVLTYYEFVIRTTPPNGGRGAYFLFYFFAQNYRTGYVDLGGGMAVAWTLCIEMSFYLALPLLAYLLRLASPANKPLATRVRLQVGVLAAASLLSLWLRYWVIQAHPLQTFWLPAHFAWFGLGMMAATWHSGSALGVELPSPVRFLGRFPVLAWLFALQAFWLTTNIKVASWVNTRPEYMAFFIGNGVSAALLLYPLVFGDQTKTRLRAVLAGQPMKWLGEVSYGIYLWHTVWLVVIAGWVTHRHWPGGFWSELVLDLAMTLTVAWLSLVLVERPLMKLVHKATASRRPAAARPG